jgi:hypothetical protein
MENTENKQETKVEKPRCTNSLEAPCYLLPCPFCGEMPHRAKPRKGSGTKTGYWYTVECRNPNCNRCESTEATIDGAVKSWNRRGPREFTGDDLNNLFAAVEKWLDTITADIEMSNFASKKAVKKRENLKSLSNKVRLWIGAR